VNHTRDDIIINAIGPLFADPEIRETLDAHDCTRVDAILRKEAHTDHDVLRLLRALEESVIHRMKKHREDGDA
jgi:adenylosuccinate lyase